MNIQIRFDQTALANEFAGSLMEKNLRGARVKRERSKPEEGSLDAAGWLPLITIAIQSGFAATVVTSIFGLLRDVFVESKKTKAENETERIRLMSDEKIDLARIDQQSKVVEFVLEDGDKRVNFSFSRGDESELTELLKIIGEMKS